MYLNKKTYIGANYEHNKITGTIDLAQDGKPFDIKLNRVSEISERVCYWRKANHIHLWFVKNVQDEEDNCAEYYVSENDLEKLIKTCEQVLSDHSLAQELLPTQDGFFFGGTDYDEYYYKNLEETVKNLKPLLEEGSTFYYNSSW